MSWDKEETNFRYRTYVHGGAENNDDFSKFHEWCDELGVDPFDEDIQEAKSRWGYALYEISLDLECDFDTGNVRCWGIEGSPLADPVEV